MFFASIGDVKRCSILVQTAQQLYGTEVRTRARVTVENILYLAAWCPPMMLLLLLRPCYAGQVHTYIFIHLLTCCVQIAEFRDWQMRTPL